MQLRHRKRKTVLPTASLLLSFSVFAIMVLGGLFQRSSKSVNTTTTTASKAASGTVVEGAMSSSTSTRHLSKESRLRGALWGLFAGDALSAPTHWYYGGFAQIQSDYGRRGITDYTKPVERLAGSILNKSDPNGGGRGGSASRNGKTIIGDIINHGKLPFWDKTKSVHYHATLQRGENTLEAQLVRVLMKSIVDCQGDFDANHFRNAYITFMTTPGSHNDTYASTCHRMFFANLIFHKLDPKDCPDNDMHNVDAIDGLVLPTIASLAAVAKGKDAAAVANDAAATAAVTRKSAHLEGASRVWGQLVADALEQSSDDTFVHKSLSDCAKGYGMRYAPSASRQDQMTACYLQQSFPPALDMMAKYVPEGDAWTGLVANANVGGENVHRGNILGAILGARAGLENLPDQLREGLYNKKELEEEIDAFVRAVLR